MPTLEAVAALAAQVRGTTAYQLLAEYITERVAHLLADDVRDPYVAMKRRGQVEELQRLLLAETLNVMAMQALQRREGAAREAPTEEPERPRDWWVAPGEEPMS